LPRFHCGLPVCSIAWYGVLVGSSISSRIYACGFRREHPACVIAAIRGKSFALPFGVFVIELSVVQIAHNLIMSKVQVKSTTADPPRQNLALGIWTLL
jgi:hypothetical protein